MKWVKKHGLLLCRIICILSFSVLISIILTQKSILQKDLNEYKNSIVKYEKIFNQLDDQYEKLKDELQKSNEEKTLLDDKIQLLQEKLGEAKKNNEEVAIQVNTLKDDNNDLKEKLMEKSTEVRLVIVDERIPESLTEFILEISDAMEEKNYEKFISYWDLSGEYGNESMPEYWYKNYLEGEYFTRIEFYDQFGTGKGSITDDYFAVYVYTGDDCAWMLVGGKKEDRWVLKFYD